jgi:hypothetical protein
MPEQAALSTVPPLSPGDGEIVVHEFDASGRKIEALRYRYPESANFKEWALKQQVGMLKQGMWRRESVANIFWGLAYAAQIGADPVLGEIFPTGDGRWGLSNKYKIRKAIETGYIEGIEAEVKELDVPFTAEKCIAKKDLECTVRIHVRGWKVPITRRARLSRWYKPSNPNWSGNPEHMLELNTIAHACEYVPGVRPVTDGEEAPPLDQAETETLVTKALEEAKEAI